MVLKLILRSHKGLLEWEVADTGFNEGWELNRGKGGRGQWLGLKKEGRLNRGGRLNGVDTVIILKKSGCKSIVDKIKKKSKKCFQCSLFLDLHKLKHFKTSSPIARRTSWTISRIFLLKLWYILEGNPVMIQYRSRTTAYIN